MRSANSVLAILAILGSLAPIQPSTFDFPDYADNASSQRMKWPTKTIRVSLSTSLDSTGPGIKPASDVTGAVRRALIRWSNAANFKFEEVSSKAQSISPASAGDGINLITIAETPENVAIFGTGNNPARTRVFYDPETGEIEEADIAINPRPASTDGLLLQFSTDGTPGTYDLESTLTHELGHLLGLEHSSVVASTMQARQAANGTYKLPALTERTLSEDDRARVTSLYGLPEGTSTIEGRLISSSPDGDPTAMQGAHVWVEDAGSGRVMASAVTAASGDYRIDGIPPGQDRVLTEYLDGPSALEASARAAAMISPRSRRPFRSVEISKQTSVGHNATTTVNYLLLPPQNSPPILRPRLIGTNGELSTAPLLAEVGKRLTIYVGGEGVDQVPASGISVMSPFMTVDTDSLTLQQFGTSFPVISFDVTVAAQGAFGDYTIRLQSNSGEVAYVAGGITIDPGVNTVALNPVDDPEFFISQNYRDFVGREPDYATLDYWTNELARCGSDVECVRARRIDVSAGLFETEFQDTWSYIYRVYKAALGRRPTLSEFISDRLQLASEGADLEKSRRAFARAFVQRTEFLKKYSSSLKSDQFLDLLVSTVLHTSEVDLSAERSNLAVLYDGTSSGRAEIVQRAADNALFARIERPRALVLMQCFAYLRREPDEGTYNSWLNVLSARGPLDPPAYRAMACNFITSAEYQSRFGMFVTHTDKECKF